MENELKPYPFCGGESEKEQDNAKT